MSKLTTNVTPYRWLVLAVFMLINIVIQVLWICYSPVAEGAALNYHVTEPDIAMLGVLFLIVYVPFAWPAAWAVDKFGIHVAVGFGAILMAIFGGLRALFPADYTMALVGSIGLAVGQPFILSAFIKLAAIWFPRGHRATITGLMFIAMFAGIGLGQAITPDFVKSFGFSGMQGIYAIAAIAAAGLFLLFARTAPKKPVEPGEAETKALALNGLGKMLRDKDVYILSIMILFGSALFNGLFLLINGFGAEKHFKTEDFTLLTGLILGGGIVGSIVLPAISDGIKKRKPVMVLATIVGGALGIALTLSTDLTVSLILGFLLGFTVTGAVPVAYQYGAEISHPTPEGTSNGFLGVVLQAAGFLIPLMIMVTEAAGKSYVPAFIGISALVIVGGILLLAVRESTRAKTNG